VACMGEGRGVYRVLVGRPDGKRPLGRPRCRWENSIKMDLREIGINRQNWIQLARLCEHRNKLVDSIRKQDIF